jgi:hypothetical protein
MNWEEHMRTLAEEARTKTWNLRPWKPGPAGFLRRNADAVVANLTESFHR